MVRGTSVSGPLLLAKNFMTNSRLVGGILADRCCSVNLICCTSHAESRYRSRLTGVDGSTGVWKAVRRLEVPL